MIACYNRVDNDPVKDHHHARVSPLDVVSSCENKSEAAFSNWLKLVW